MTDPWINNPWAPPKLPTPVEPTWLTDALKLTLAGANLPLNKDGMLMLWQQSQETLETAKAEEMDYRKICVALLVPDNNEGMNTVELGSGFKAKAQIKYNYKLDSDNKKVWAGLDKIAALGNEGKFIAERLISWTPSLSLTEYRNIQDEAKDGSIFAKDALKTINEFLTINEATPTLEIKAPKQKK